MDRSEISLVPTWLMPLVVAVCFIDRLSYAWLYIFFYMSGSLPILVFFSGGEFVCILPAVAGYPIPYSDPELPSPRSPGVERRAQALERVSY